MTTAELSGPALTATPGRAATLARELALAALLLVLALVIRAPALLYSVTNFDESLYLLFGDDLARGVLPYTHICDRKPFGLFALFGLFASSPFDALTVSRLAATLSVAATAYLLHRVAGRLLDDRDRLVGPAAALAYVTFSLVDGGLASNSEIFLNLFTVSALLLALHAAQGRERPSLPLLLAAGLTLGCGIQVKPTILFDMLAFLAGFLILTTPRPADLVPRLRATWRQLAALGVVALLPTLAVVLLYAATGHFGEWATANIGGQRGFVDDPGQRIEWLAAFWAVLEQAPLWLGAALATLLAPRLLRDPAEARSLAFLLVWVAALCLLQLFLRIAADHYFLQFLPPLCLLAGLFLGRTLLARAATSPLRTGLLATVLALTLFASGKNPFANAAYVTAKRYVDGHAGAADAARRVAARVNELKRPGDALYQVGFLPVVYHLTGTLPQLPTRFAFTGLPHATYAGRDGCPWVPPETEMRRILDTRPRFIVIEDGIFYKKLEAPVRALLDDRLASDYRLVVHVPDHWIHHSYPLEHFVMNGAAGAWLYVLKEDPGTPPG